MDVLKVLVEGDMLATFVNLFTVVFAIDFVSMLSQVLRMK